MLETVRTRATDAVVLQHAADMQSFNLNHELLVELGLAHLSPGQERRLLERIYEVLEMRVGAALSRGMTERQRNQFEKFMDTDEDAAAMDFLDANIPEYSAVVQGELLYIYSHVATRLAAATASLEVLE